MLYNVFLFSVQQENQESSSAGPACCLSRSYHLFTWWGARRAHWRWCGTESTAKTNYAGWRGFSTLLYSPWQRAVQSSWKGPSSHQTAPNKERGPDRAQLMRTQGMCVSSTRCHTLLPCFGDSCPNSVLLYTQSCFTQLAACRCNGAFLERRALRRCV